MDTTVSIGWMRMGLRAQICPQCRPNVTAGNPLQVLNPTSCEGRCALFVQLPRLARFFQRYSGKPPSGYEDFAEKLLSDSSAVSIEVDPSTPQQFPAPFLEYSIDALAILEHIALLTSKLTFE